MSNDKTDCPTEVIPTVPSASNVPVRRSILHAAQTKAPAGAPSGRPSPSPPAGWRDRVPTEELPAIAAGTGRRAHCLGLRRHLLSALVGSMLAIVAISGLSAYAAQGIADARQAALDHARSQVSTAR